MPPKDNVQLLIQAEERRNKIVAEAKARKQTKVKQAKADAEATVGDFRREKDAEYQAFKDSQMNAANNDNAKTVADTDRQIETMKKLAGKRTDKVSDLIVGLITSVEAQA